MSRDYSWMLRGADDEQECALRVDLHRTSSLDFKTSRLSATAAGGECAGGRCPRYVTHSLGFRPQANYTAVCPVLSTRSFNRRSCSRQCESAQAKGEYPSRHGYPYGL